MGTSTFRISRDTLYRWENRTVELYIPPPPTHDDDGHIFWARGQLTYRTGVGFFVHRAGGTLEPVEHGDLMRILPGYGNCGALRPVYLPE